MDKTDYFREIAMTKHPLGSDDKEIAPLAVPNIRLQKTDDSFDYNACAMPNFKEQCAQFDAELARLREQYQPFMQNLCESLPKTVDSIALKSFTFRYLGENEPFAPSERDDNEKENITIPDYRGPAAEKGKWRGCYRTSFAADMPDDGKKAVLYFQCVDYKAVVYLNGFYVGEHEGFFAPFFFDVTNMLREQNELVVICHNDIPILGTGPVLDGDKIYAATGPGWDEAVEGWHHCPAGAGIFGEVQLQYRPSVFIEDVFVRADIDNNCAEVRVGIINYNNEVLSDYALNFDIAPKNYKGEQVSARCEELHFIGVGKNEYRFSVPLQGYRLWECDSPWLYTSSLQLLKDKVLISTLQSTTGLKKFVSDEASFPKGKFFLNNRPVVLRGANEMGHLQQCVMNGDTQLLINDILIAKMCNMNYYRVAQRPVQSEIYDAFDALGMMHQCDLPLFSFLRRPQFAEAVKQTVEMEHLIRQHVSSVMVTFINEPVCVRKTQDPTDKFSTRYYAKGHRHLQRDELEAFFAAARKAVYVENPDRVIKNVEGDYDPPTTQGMPDFHSYTMWYTNHAMPIGKLLKGYIPPVKGGWMIGCGEYGAEGIDNESIIRTRYPKQWLLPNSDGSWFPSKIVRAQTWGAHADWYEEQYTISDWVRESQRHQSKATKLMTDALRRRSDLISHTAIHLLIDAWPSGWMKTLVGCDRKPKPAFFEYKQSLTALRASLYIARQHVFSQGEISADVWLLNDASTDAGTQLYVSARSESGEHQTQVYSICAGASAAGCACVGQAVIALPRVEKTEKFIMYAYLKDKNGKISGCEQAEFYVYPQVKAQADTAALGAAAQSALKAQGIAASELDGVKNIIISDFSEKNIKLAENALENGKNVLALIDKSCEQAFDICNINISTKPCTDLFFAVACGEAKDLSFAMLYNENDDYIDYTASCTINASEVGEELVYTYASSSGHSKKEHRPIAQRFNAGKAKLSVLSMYTDGRVGVNACVDTLICRMLGE